MEEKRSKVGALISNVSRQKSKAMGSRFRDARTRRGWSQSECAERAGMSLSTIKLVEQGDPKVSWAYYLALLQVFGQSSEVDGICSACRDVVLQNGKRFLGSVAIKFDKDL